MDMCDANADGFIRLTDMVKVVHHVQKSAAVLRAAVNSEVPPSAVEERQMRSAQFSDHPLVSARRTDSVGSSVRSGATSHLGFTSSHMQSSRRGRTFRTAGQQGGGTKRPFVPRVRRQQQPRVPVQLAHVRVSVPPQLDFRTLNQKSTLAAKSRFDLTPRPQTAHIVQPSRAAPSYADAGSRFTTTNKAMEANEQCVATALYSYFATTVGLTVAVCVCVCVRARVCVYPPVL